MPLRELAISKCDYCQRDIGKVCEPDLVVGFMLYLRSEASLCFVLFTVLGHARSIALEDRFVSSVIDRWLSSPS